MPADQYSQKNVYLTFNSPLGRDKLLLDSIKGSEAISELFEYDLQLFSPDSSLNAKKIIGKSCTAVIKQNDGSSREINGIVSRFYQAGRNKRLCIYGATLRPSLWLLTLSKDCCIFQNKSIPEIIESILKNHNIRNYEKSLKGVYKKIDYIVQYNETAFEFISRLMEEYGIFYFFKHANKLDKIVIADDSNAHTTCPGIGKGSIRYVPGNEREWSDSKIISECIFNDRVTTGQVALDDYNFETPTLDLKVSVKGNPSKNVQYEYPARFQKTADGKKLARIRMEELELHCRNAEGQSPCHAFVSGHKFKLVNFYRKDFNDDYVITRVSHFASREEYSNTFEAIPSEVPFRPQRITRKPVIPGAQTALVVGPKGKETWTDKYGRVKVQFHWDKIGKKDDKSSCWIRVSQGWAGKKWGAFFLPRIGMEVVVEFLDGDPDRPLVTGAVYNGKQSLPYPLPAKDTVSTIKTNTSEGGKGFNEIRMEDKKGKEEIFIQAEKDMKSRIKNDRTIIVDKGDENHTITKGKRTLVVEKGNEDHSVGGTRKLEIKKSEQHINKDKFTHTVDGNYTLTVKGNLKIDVKGTISVTSGKSATYKSKTGTTIQAGTGLTTKAGTSHTSKAGTGMKLDAKTSLSGKGGISTKIEGGTKTDIKSGAMLNIKAGATLKTEGGAMHQAKSGGIMQVQGALVKIN